MKDITREKMRIVKRRVDSKKSLFQTRCISCGQRCMRSGGSFVGHVTDERPVGEINGVNQQFTLERAPIAKTTEVGMNHEEKTALLPFLAYEVEGKQLNLKFPPPVGATIVVDYLYEDDCTDFGGTHDTKTTQ